MDKNLYHMPVKSRLPEVKSLYHFLPKGTEGGKEFSRVIDLLIYYDAKRNGKKAMLFSDSAGDYLGLDAFEGAYREELNIGYQYKFFPSPLSNTHRNAIEESLKIASEKNKKKKLKTWVLVTPDDLLESSTKKSGGDVTWFEGLKEKYSLPFDIEHWGHKKILALFLQTPSLCLYYYPELISEGVKKKKTIEEVRNIYIQNIIKKYRTIEFVGMSVYKHEATRGVPMEHIYIPLAVIPEGTKNSGSLELRTNPLSFIRPNAHHVILGDPGSGKSTLLKFLALSGISSALKRKYKTKTNNKTLPILITLRSYADELKSRANISLIEYIQETVNGDFSLDEADNSFFRYYLETGQAILFFDGLDELPDSKYKKTVRDRIIAFATTFPGNTIIISSRIVGYENPFRFDEIEFKHFVVAKLALEEIINFVENWYNVRVEDAKDRISNVNDLVRILSDENNNAIRELAENPLLLTIVALVHRIDAVLPDERVVLYQKCTETLLNTWHTWKYKDAVNTGNRGRIERKNRQRMESIALWMHKQSTSVKKNERSIVLERDLLQFLTSYINESEHTNIDDAQDIATEFLDFIKTKAGLLIEVGDRRYSFVHLTFQEYLASSCLITQSENRGISQTWGDLLPHLADRRWHEIIRLLIAGLKSDESQENIICSIIKENNLDLLSKSTILIGLLTDNVDAAERNCQVIIELIIDTCLSLEKTEDTKSLLAFIGRWGNKDANKQKIMSDIVCQRWEKADNNIKEKLLLLSFACGINNIQLINKNINNFLEENSGVLKLFFYKKKSEEDFSSDIEKKIRQLSEFILISSTISPSQNFLAAALISVIYAYDEFLSYKLFAIVNLVAYNDGEITGPFSDFTDNLLKISSNKIITSRALSQSRRNKANELKRYTSATLEEIRNICEIIIEEARSKKHHEIGIHEDNDRILISLKKETSDFWPKILNSSNLSEAIIEVITDIFSLKQSILWSESLRLYFLPKIPSLTPISNINLEYLKKTLQKPQDKVRNSSFLASMLWLDTWARIYYMKPAFEDFDIELYKKNMAKDDYLSHLSNLFLKWVSSRDNTYLENIERYTNENRKEILAVLHI